MRAISRDAHISDCGRYRYSLMRQWGDKRFCLWVMLNPSTANAHIDDPTIRRCMGFSEAWGYGGMVVVNVYAYRATKPKELWLADDPFGPENCDRIAEAQEQTVLTVAAWGSNAREHEAIHTYWQLAAQRPVYCLGVTKDGFPKHPLYIKGSTVPELYEVKGSAEISEAVQCLE